MGLLRSSVQNSANRITAYLATVFSYLMAVSTSPTETSLQLEKLVEFQDIKQQINWKSNTLLLQPLSQSSPRLSKIILYKCDSGTIEYKTTWITHHMKIYTN